MADTTPKTTAPAPPPVYSPEQGKVAIYDRDGSVWKVPEADLPKALSEGARPATEAEYWSVKHGRTATGAAAAAVGAARGLGETFGLPTDAAAIEGARILGGDETAESARHGLNLLKEAHPIASEVGEYAGMAIPMFFGAGEAGLAARGASLAGRAAKAAIVTGIEGAGMGVAAQANEDALGNHAFVAENYATAAFRDGALGVLLGGGITAATERAAAAKAAASSKFFGRGAVVEAEQLAAHDAADFVDRSIPRTPREVSPDFAGPMAEGGPRVARPTDVSPLDAPFGAEVPPRPANVSPDLGDAGLGFAPEARPGTRAERRAAVEAGLFEPEPVAARTDNVIAGGRTRIEPRMPGGEVAGEARSDLSFFDTDRARLGGARADEGLPGRTPPAGGGAVRDFAPTELGTARRFAGAPGEARAAEEIIDAAGAAGERTSLGRGPLGSSSVRASEEIGPSVRDRLRAERTAARDAELAGLEGRSTLESMSKMSDRRAFEATGAKIGDLRKLGGTAAEIQVEAESIGSTIKREVGMKPFDTAESLNKRIVAKLDEVGKSIPKMYKELDQAVTRPDLSRVLQRYEAEVRQPAMKTMYGDLEVGRANDALSRFQRAAGEKPSFTRMWEVRKQLDAELFEHFDRPRSMGAAELPRGEKALRDLHAIVNEELQVAAEKASLEMKTDTAARLRFANDTYRDLRRAKDITTREAARAGTVGGNQRFSLTDVIAATASPLAGAANHVRRVYGDAIASVALERATKLKAVQDASTKVDQLLKKRTRAFIAGEKPKDLRGPTTITAKEVSEIHKQVSNPAAVRANIEAALGDLPKYAPKTAVEFATHVTRVAALLAQTLPKTAPPPGPVFTRPKERPLSDTELRKAAATIETLKDPSIVVDRIMQGRLTVDHVRALKMGSPENYVAIRNYLNEHAIDLRPQMDVQDQITLSILFEMPIAEVMKPANVRALQASFVGGNQAPKAGTSASLGPSLPKMAAGPVKGGGTSATHWSEFAKTTR